MIYLDYNATTPLATPAREAMEPYLTRHFGNASSVHAAGREARAAVDDARDRLTSLLQIKPHELIFTSGGTESNNLGVMGLARAAVARGRHLICSSTEHHAVLHAFTYLAEREQFDVTYLPVNREGVINLEELEAAIRPSTTLVSVMAANNETGTIQPVAEIAERCRARGVLFHSDMVQSLGKTATDLREVDAASFTAHKFHGPKGAGLLYVRAGLPIEAMQLGGAHENQRRAGTENVAAIVGMAAAAELALRDWAREQQREAYLRDLLATGIREIFPGVRENGASNRLANTLNCSFPGFDSETLLMALDLEGVCASSGSACMVGSVMASHVLVAMGAPADEARSAIRFSLGRETTAEEIKQTLAALGRIFARLGRIAEAA